MYAWQPWSGHYVVPPTVWASAHTTQFVAPGWKMLHGASGDLAQGGSFLTMVSPDGKDFSMVVETGHAACHHCNYAADTASTVSQDLDVTLSGGLAGVKTVSVWHTSNATMFEKVGSDVKVDSGKITLTVLPESGIANKGDNVLDLVEFNSTAGPDDIVVFSVRPLPEDGRITGSNTVV